MLKLIFGFDHVNYARYSLFQHAFLSNLSKGNPQAFADLLKYRFRATSLGETFSTIHGDLVTEEVKLFARCLLLFARCSLIFARCPLFFA